MTLNLRTKNSGSVKVTVCQADITHTRCSAVVNSTDPELRHAAGVSRAIADAAGSRFREKSVEALTRSNKPYLSPGDICCLPAGGQLKKQGVNHVINIVMPTGCDDDSDAGSVLTALIYESLMRAESLKCSSVAVPPVGLGIAGVPMDQCLQSYWEGVQRYLQQDQTDSIREIHFVSIEPEVAAAITDYFEAEADGLSTSATADNVPQSPALVPGAQATGSVSPSSASGSKAAALTPAPPAGTVRCDVCLEDKNVSEFEKLKCGHSFCQTCVKQYVEVHKNDKCPTCKQPFTAPKRSRLPGSRMRHSTQRSTSLSGYPGCGVIAITYDIPGGVQTAEHPNPGQSYSGTSREAYLPDNTQGRRVLRLLSKAFDLGLIFTVGTSLTTGQSNTVVWNDIHHKTSLSGQYGYPDPNYLDSVEADLKARGVTE